jgi:hypothetical protein
MEESHAEQGIRCVDETPLEQSKTYETNAKYVESNGLEKVCDLPDFSRTGGG